MGTPSTAPSPSRQPTQQQRAAVHRLLGRPPRPGTTLTVSLPDVDDVVRRSGSCPDGLPAAVVAMTGAVTDRVAAAAELEGAWQRAFAPLETLAEHRPQLAEWLTVIRRTGVVRRLARTPEEAARLLTDLARVIRNLPSDGEPLARFAARVAGGAHALDEGQPLATLALGAARALTGVRDGQGAPGRREAWASVGLLCDELSTTVLTLGLRGEAQSATGRALAAWHQAGQPVVLTLRQLVREAPRLRAPRVFVCENPAVVSAAADCLGSECAPLVCTSGQPGAAAMHLLRLLAAAGAELRYHGDFDWGGIRIGNVVFDRVPALPWRFSTGDYLNAVHRGRLLAGIPVAARWDDNLATAMRDARVAVEEEHVIEDLLQDLSA